MYDIPEPDVTFVLETPDKVPIGEDFDVKVCDKKKRNKNTIVLCCITQVESSMKMVPVKKIMVYN